MRTGQQCFVPVITDPKNGLMELVGLRGEEDLRGLDANAWGIPEPAVESVDTRANGAVECTSTAHRSTTRHQGSAWHSVHQALQEDVRCC